MRMLKNGSPWHFRCVAARSRFNFLALNLWKDSSNSTPYCLQLYALPSTNTTLTWMTKMEEHTQVSTGHKCSDKRHSSNYCLHTAAEFDLRGCSGAAVKYSLEELGSDPKRLLEPFVEWRCKNSYCFRHQGEPWKNCPAVHTGAWKTRAT